MLVLGTGAVGLWKPSYLPCAQQCVKWGCGGTSGGTQRTRQGAGEVPEAGNPYP